MIHLSHPVAKPTFFLMLILVTGAGFFLKLHEDALSEGVVTRNDIKMLMRPCEEDGFDEECFLNEAAERYQNYEAEALTWCDIYATLMGRESRDSGGSLTDNYLQLQESCLAELEARAARLEAGESLEEEEVIIEEEVEQPVEEEVVTEEPVEEPAPAPQGDEASEVVEEPTVDEPVVEEPVAEEPSQEPVVPEPTPEEPTPGEEVPAEEPVEEPVSEEEGGEPVSEEPAIEEPTPEEPVPEQPVSEPSAEEAPVSESPESSNDTEAPAT